MGVRDLEAGEDRSVTQYGTWDDTKGYTDANAISRDGKQIAFWHFTQNWATSGQLRVVGADGRGERTVYRAKEAEWGMPTDWSPDGKYVIVQLERSKEGSIEGDTDFAIFSVADGSVRVLKSYHHLRQHRPRILFSPDGKYVAYDYPPQPGGANSDIYVIPVNGGPEIAVAPHPAHDYLFGWTPDGSILFVSFRTGAFGIWKVGVRNGRQTAEPELIRPNVDRIRPLGITKNGGSYYTVSNERSNVYVADIDVATTRVGQPVRAAASQIDTTSYASWSPDGKRISFLVATPVAPRLIVSKDFPDGVVNRLTPRSPQPVNISGQPRWSPDGLSLHMWGNSNGRRGLLRIAADTGEARLIMEMGARWDGFDWSADGKYVFFPLRGEKIHQIVRRNTVSGEENILYSGPRRPRGIAVSPDGRRLVFVLFRDKADEKGCVCTLPADGGEVKVLDTPAEGDLPWRVHEITWTPDGEKVLFSNSKGLWIVSADAGGPAEKTSLKLPGSIGQLSMHPDGKRIAFTNSTSTTELWAMENFLR